MVQPLNNTYDLESMKTAVWVVSFHLLSTNESPQHGLCPAGTNSWCKFQKAEAELNEKYYDHKKTYTCFVPFSIMNDINPIFRDLAETMLLKNTYMERLKTPMSQLIIPYGQ
ncbi:hypothetical protein TNCV_582291 [Trichonephila clavipes]|nr:hypothetical protein TNCV_582291 [Trichonephila clavipes]